MSKLSELRNRIDGRQAEIDQIDRMIEENYRQIKLGDDIVNREDLIKHLTAMKQDLQFENNEDTVELNKILTEL